MLYKNGQIYSRSKQELEELKKAFPTGIAEIRYDASLTTKLLTEKRQLIDSRPEIISIPTFAQLIKDGETTEFRFTPSRVQKTKEGDPIWPTKIMNVSNSEVFDMSDPVQLDKLHFLYFYSDRVTNNAIEALSAGAQHIYFYSEEAEYKAQIERELSNENYKDMFLNPSSSIYIDDKELERIAAALPGVSVRGMSTPRVRMTIYNAVRHNQRVSDDFMKLYDEPNKDVIESVTFVKELLATKVMIIDEKGAQYKNVKDEMVVFSPTIKVVTDENIGKIATNLYAPKQKSLLEELRGLLAAAKENS
jgi:hypothetical protein